MCHRARPILRGFATSLALAALCLAGIPCHAADELEIIYLANEGFLLRSGEQVVLIDALFGSGLRGYGVVPDETREQLETGAPPFDAVDVVLASHFHRDHFDARSVARFLSANPEARFISTEHAVHDLLEVAPDLAARVLGVYPAEGSVESPQVNGIALRVFNLHHGPGIQNLGMLIEICGTNVLHIGDTEATAEDLRTAGLQNLRIDLALLPSWYLRNDGSIDAVREVIKPGRIGAMHLPASDAPSSYFWGGLRDLDALVAAIQTLFPTAWVPLASGDSLAIPCHANAVDVRD